VLPSTRYARSGRIGAWDHGDEARQGSGKCHPHLHVLIARPSCRCLRGRRPGDDGPTCRHGKLWCPHALNQCCLSKAWQAITGDSFVVDIRAIHADGDGSMRGAVREVVKDGTKLTEASGKEREDGLSDVLEHHRAIRRRRLLMTAGVFRGLVEPITADAARPGGKQAVPYRRRAVGDGDRRVGYGLRPVLRVLGTAWACWPFWSSG
jgi:hypothetical protein